MEKAKGVHYRQENMITLSFYGRKICISELQYMTLAQKMTRVAPGLQKAFFL